MIKHIENSQNQSYRFYCIWTALLLLFFPLLFSSCQETEYIPKPRAYPRVVVPEKAYEHYQPVDCPFSFEKPTYAEVIKDTLFFKQKPEHPCWMDMKFPDLNAQMHFSYKTIEKREDLAKLLNDAYKLNAKHFKKADYSDDSLFITKNGVYGIYYKVGGDAASSTQLAITDSVNHFIWTSLYFKETPNADSIRPIVQFLRKDIDRMIETFRFE